jgi:hypothetical protein
MMRLITQLPPPSTAVRHDQQHPAIHYFVMTKINVH